MKMFPTGDADKHLGIDLIVQTLIPGLMGCTADNEKHGAQAGLFARDVLQPGASE